METFVCLNCGDGYVVSKYSGAVKFKYCKKPECQKARQHAIDKERWAKVKPKSKTVKCLNCGGDFLLVGKALKTVHPYCKKEECQKVKRKKGMDRYKARMRRYYRKVSKCVYGRVYIEKTGKACLRCKKPIYRTIEEYYDDDLHKNVKFIKKENHTFCDACGIKNKREDAFLNGSYQEAAYGRS